MKQHLNTLFMTTQGAYVHCEGEAALIRIEGETRLRIPLHMIGGVVCFGQVSCSPAFMGRCGDRFVLSMVNKRQLRSRGFRKSESGAVLMDDDTRKAILTAYQEGKQEAINHPFLGEETTVGLLLHIQAQLLAGFFRGDLDAYPPFIWR